MVLEALVTFRLRMQPRKEVEPSTSSSSRCRSLWATTVCHWPSQSPAPSAGTCSAGAGLCDGQWHTVVAHKLRHRLELEFKKQMLAQVRIRLVSFAACGVRQAALSTSTSFRGCMRNLKVTKASRTMEVYFNKALEIRGVQPLSCPAVAA
ncbi:hypothetical protein CRUP_031020 [Coryphaenoides rupestris]|nr:hypothetical protein CRUP_031020 [Coryphaenoides rupestris]